MGVEVEGGAEVGAEVVETAAEVRVVGEGGAQYQGALTPPQHAILQASLNLKN